MDKIFEMLWDCRYCGTRKLLGKTHRFCPGCGSPQDPKGRYFPEDADKVEVKDHVYVGADRHCPACQSAMSARAAHCTQCGSPLDGASVVPLVSDLPGPAAEAPSPPPEAPPPSPEAPHPSSSVEDSQPLFASSAAPSSRWRRWAALAGAGLFLLCGGFCSIFFFTEPVQARVVSRTWKRSIEVEAFRARRGAD